MSNIFYAPLTSSSPHKLPPLQEASKEALQRTNTEFWSALTAGLKTPTGVHEQPLGVGETQHGSETRRDNMLSTLQQGTPESIQQVFGATWRLDDNRESTLLLSAEAGMMQVGELHWFMEKYAKDHIREYEIMVKVYEQFRRKNAFGNVTQLVLPTLKDLQKYTKDNSQYDWVDTAWTVTQRISPNLMTAAWSPAIVMPSEAVQTASLLRNALVPDILVADVIEMFVKNGYLPTVDGVVFDRTDPHNWATSGRIPRRMTIKAGFYAAIRMALQTNVLKPANAA